MTACGHYRERAALRIIDLEAFNLPFLLLLGIGFSRLASAGAMGLSLEVGETWRRCLRHFLNSALCHKGQFAFIS